VQCAFRSRAAQSTFPSSPPYVATTLCAGAAAAAHGLRKWLALLVLELWQILRSWTWVVAVGLGVSSPMRQPHT
jgi:hypothetical protein